MINVEIYKLQKVYFIYYSNSQIFNSDNFNFLKIIFKKIYLSLHIKSFNSNCYHNSTIISSSIHTSTITLYTHWITLEFLHYFNLQAYSFFVIYLIYRD